MVQWMCERNQSESACFAQVSSSKPSCGINGPWRICSRLLCSKCCFVGTQRHTGKRYFWCHFFRPKVFQMQYTQLECPDQTQLWDLPGISYTPSGHIIPQEFTGPGGSAAVVFCGWGASTEQQRRRIGKSLRNPVVERLAKRQHRRLCLVKVGCWNKFVSAWKIHQIESDFKFNGNSAAMSI